MSETGAICSKCNALTTGKIYDPYWCSDCKIKNLEEQRDHYRESYDYAEAERGIWVKKYNEESIQKTKYRHAFECLYEKLSNK